MEPVWYLYFPLRPLILNNTPPGIEDRGFNMTTVGEKIRHLREKFGMTGQEVAELGGLQNQSQISKVENGHNQATTLSMRVGLAKGFGLTLDEMNSYIDGRINIDAAFRAGFTRISSKLKEIRDRSAMAHQDELEEAIQQVRGSNISPAVINYVREIAARGRTQTVERWVHTIHYLNGIMDRLAAGKPVVAE